jgi:hypothetical protein
MCELKCLKIKIKTIYFFFARGLTIFRSIEKCLMRNILEENVSLLCTVYSIYIGLFICWSYKLFCNILFLNNMTLVISIDLILFDLCQR